ncbi:MAG TPA: UDP-3-O-(3-hydroxymyristoyl)glucosamine N-acyltransferase [Luteibaculaceae bacterium]|nr:UDP-3-O-(3-hydroxymyristoyl)glucosamine N-acyltransferase [Luteibaculaceae bacterium]
MEFSAKQIADLLGGQVVGDPESRVTRLAKIEEAQQGALSFLANPKYTEFIYRTQASIVIVSASFTPEQSLPEQLTLIKVPDAYQSFARLLEVYSTLRKRKAGIEQPSFVHPSASLGADCYLGAFSYIDEGSVIGAQTIIHPQVRIGQRVTIGANCEIHSGVVIYDECVIGDHVVIHANTVIGADGFGFAPNSENQYNKVPQIGNVILEDRVEVGANTTIDRATLGSTIIRKGVKLDNLIQVAHNVEIGENTVIAAQTGIAGSTKIGKNCMIGGQVGIVGHLTIADEVKIAAQSGVGQSVLEKGAVLQGSPAFAVGDYKRSYVMFKKLPSIHQTLTNLENEIQQIQQKIQG